MNCTGPNSCTSCVPGFVVNSSGLCQACIANCQYCQTTTTCQVCTSGFFVNSASICQACVAPCSECIGTSANCTACPADSFLYQGQCIRCYDKAINCVACESTNMSFTCLGCRTGYYLNANNNSCMACSANCQICSNFSTCTTCQVSYFLTVNNTCQPCSLPNCLTCAYASSCSICALGTFLSSAQTCEPCSSGCAKCLSLTQCQQCATGYLPYMNQCFPCNLECNNCLHAPNLCMSCQPGFYQVAPYGRCLPCPYFCELCTNPNNCTSCAPAYYLQNNRCLVCSVAYCFSCEASGTSNVCTLCMSGYYLSSTGASTQCLPCQQANCSVCTNKTACELCDEGYFLVNGSCQACLSGCETCVNSTTCTDCFNGLYLNQNSTLCILCPQGCDTCVSSSICRSCEAGYYLQSNNGVSTNTCGRCTAPCLECQFSNTYCTFCAVGYELTAPGVCSRCQTGCLACDGFVGCLYCAPGYLKLTNENVSECLPCPSNCISCHYNATTQVNQCTQCQYSFTLQSDGQCLQCGSTEQTRACQVCTANGECAICFPGFTKNSSGICFTDDYVPGESSWPWIGANIGLSCLLMFLLSKFFFKHSCSALSKNDQASESVRVYLASLIINNEL